MISYSAKELILLYLKNYDEYRESDEAPYGVSLPGIASAIGKKRDDISDMLGILEEDGLIERRTSSVRGRKRKRNVFYLTKKGMDREHEIRNKIKEENVKINLRGEIKEIKLAQIDDYIEQEDPIVKTLSRMEKGDIVDLSEQSVKEDVFVGRDQEMKLLCDKLNEVRGSGSITTFISGEAGVGKTRLVSEFKRYALEEGVDFLAGTCLSEAVDPYLPFKEAFDEYLNKEVENVDNRIAFLGTYKSREASSKKVFDAEREATYYETTEYIRNISMKNPLVVFLDDVQWIDHASAQILNYMTYKLNSAPVLFICAYRPEDLRERKAILEVFRHMKSSYPQVWEMHLSPLDKDSTEEVIHGLLQTQNIPDDYVEMIHEKTNGNPLFVKECVKHMLEEDMIDPEECRFPRPEMISVPDIIQHVIKHRIDRLDERSKKILEVGSVIGDVIDFSLLSEIVDIGTFDLLDCIDILFSTGLLQESPDEEKLFFHHSITRDTVYNGLRGIKKRLIHGKTAECMESLYPDEMEDLYPTLAYHYDRADELEKALDYYFKAGERAKKIYAHENAIEMYEKGLMMAEKIDDSQTKELDIKEELSEIYWILGDYEKSREYLQSIQTKDIDPYRKCKVYRKLSRTWLVQGDLDKAQEMIDMGLDVIEDQEEFKPELCKLLSFKGWAKMDMGEHDKAVKLFQEQREISENIGEEKLIGRAHHDLGTIFYTKGKTDSAKNHLERAIEIWKDIDDEQNLVSSLNNLGLVMMYNGEWDKAREYFEENLKNNNEMGDILGKSISLNNLGDIYRETGNLEKALEYFNRAKSIQEKIGDKNGAAGSVTNIGITYYLKGELDKALELHEKSLETFNEGNNTFRMAWVLYSMGDIFIEKDRLEKANERLKKANELYKKMGEEGERAATETSLSTISLKRGNIEEAEEKVLKALDRVKGKSIKTVEGRCRLVLSKIYREKASWDEAHVELDKAKELLEGTVTEYPKALYELGMLYQSQGDDSSAQEYFESAKEIFQRSGMELWYDKCQDAIER